MRVRSALAVALAAVAMLTSGCTRTLDKQGLEAQLAAGLQADGSSGLTVRCPDGVKAESGATFQCTATDPEGATLSITVTQTDDQGNVTWEVSDASNATPTPSSLPSPTPTT